MADPISHPEKSPGVPLMASYGLGRFIVELLTGAFSAVVFKYYETEVHLAVGLVALGFVLHSIWNAISYPLVGYLTGKPTFVSKLLGRRFPWILVGAPLSIVTFLLVFIPPTAGPWVLFAWMVVASCLYDFFNSLWELNYQSLYPDRFRTFESRNLAAGVGTVVGTFGVVGGAILPTLFIVYGQAGSYLTSALVVGGVGLAAAFLMVPGVRETKSMISRFNAQADSDRLTPRPSFRQQLVGAFGHRNFVAFILLYFFYQAAVLTMQSSIYYVGDYLLNGASTTTIFAAMLVGALVSIPLWHALAKRSRSNQRMLLWGAAALAVFSLPLAFLNTLLGYQIALFLWGTAFGGFWFLLNPAMADVVDEIVVQTGRRDDGVFYGFRAFFGRLSLLVQALSFWIIHEATGFTRDPHSPSALWGIQIHVGLLPAALLVVGAVLYARINNLTPEKCAEHRRELSERGL